MGQRERSAFPHLDNARQLVRSLNEELLDYRTLLDGKVDAQQLDLLEEAIKAAKSLVNRRVYHGLGGASHQEYWGEGDQVFKLLRDVEARLRMRVSQDPRVGARTKLAAAARNARRKVEGLLDLQSAGQADPDWMKAVLDRGSVIERSIGEAVHLAADAGPDQAAHASAAMGAFERGLDRIEDIWGSRTDARKRYTQSPSELCAEAAAEFQSCVEELENCGAAEKWRAAEKPRDEIEAGRSKNARAPARTTGSKSAGRPRRKKR